MGISEQEKILLSQLIDGELPVDQANRVLAGVFGELSHVLGNSEAAGELNDMLQLRQTLDPWRRQEPPSAIVAIPPLHYSQPSSRFRHRAIGLAAAAVLGAILVAAGFMLRGQFNPAQPLPSVAARPAVIVSPEQRREIAKTFALHESVAGPLSWFASDDSTIQVAPAQKGEVVRRPIAIVLRMSAEAAASSGDWAASKTYVVVCRGTDAIVELPQSANKTLRVRLLPTETDGKVCLQYVIAADGLNHGPNEAAIAGRRRVDLQQTSLGQLALSDSLLNVDASAWVIGNRGG